MNKNLIYAAMGAVILMGTASCSKDNEGNGSDIENKKSITFVVDDLKWQKDNMAKTRATLASENISSVEVYDGMTKVVTQSSSDEDFGAPSLELTYGQHTLYFVAHRSEGASFTDGVWSATKVRGTFMKKVTLTVSPSTEASQSVELDRKIYRLKFLIQDMIPATAATANITVGTYYGAIKFSDFSGANSETDKTTSIDISSLVGLSDPCDVSVYGFCPTDGTEYKTNVSIAFYKSDNTLIQSHSKSDIPLQTNYITTLKGNYFQTTPSWSISLSSDWGGEKEVEL